MRASDDFEMLAPVELSIFCFRYLPASMKPDRDDEQLNAFNERLLVALQRDGSSYLSNAMIHGRFALRGCVMNYRTTPTRHGDPARRSATGRSPALAGLSRNLSFSERSET